MDERRGPWYLLTGLLMGLALGLLYAWFLDPVQYANTSPDALRPEFKDQYRILIAQAYPYSGDLGRARGRLALLKDDRPSFELGAQAQRILAAGGSVDTARALARLSSDLNLPEGSLPPQTSAGTPAAGDPALPPTATLSPDEQIQTPTPAPSPTRPQPPTFTPRPSPTRQPTQDAPFRLDDQQVVCGDPQRSAGLLAVETLDGGGNPLAGVRIQITWEGGENAFFTGLYPEISPGYADFVMQPDVTYTLRAGEGGELVEGLSATPCKDAEGKAYLGGWKLVFVLP